MATSRSIPEGAGRDSATVLPGDREGSLGATMADATDPTDLWIEDQDPAKLFSLGVDGMWVRVAGVDYPVIDQSADRRQLLLDGAAGAVTTGEAYVGIYKFDSVTVTGRREPRNPRRRRGRNLAGRPGLDSHAPRPRSARRHRYLARGRNAVRRRRPDRHRRGRHRPQRSGLGHLHPGGPVLRRRHRALRVDDAGSGGACGAGRRHHDRGGGRRGQRRHRGPDDPGPPGGPWRSAGGHDGLPEPGSAPRPWNRPRLRGERHPRRRRGARRASWSTTTRPRSPPTSTPRTRSTTTCRRAPSTATW